MFTCPNCGHELGITHPGHEQLGEREVGFKHAIALAWRAIEKARSATDCRTKLVEMGTKPVPDLSGPPRRDI